jgi:hypothetical protein
LSDKAIGRIAGPTFSQKLLTEITSLLETYRKEKK